MAATLFTDIRIFDGSGDDLFPGEVLVQGNRIKQVAYGMGQIPRNGATLVEGGGATLMPGLIEAHAHLSFPHRPTYEEIGQIPPEEHTLITAYNAKTLIDAGFTSAFSAASAKPRLDIVIRNEINAGRLPGPRLKAASPEITATGGFGDIRRMHMDQTCFEIVADGPHELRRVVRLMAREGVDTIKMNLSGDNLTGRAGFSERLGFTDEETAAVADQAHAWGINLACHAQAAASVKMALRHGFLMIYHCSFADEEALDMLEAKKAEIFVAPAVGIVYATAHNAEAWGITKEIAEQRGMFKAIERVSAVYHKMRKRGIRVLPGGDYGFAWNPIGTNARDLEHFVKLFGYTPAETLMAATKLGGQLMGMGNELGQVAEGYLADLILVDGDPVADITLFQDHARILMIMKDGAYHKAPTKPRSGEVRRRKAG
jgi:imidazolonepropionase-like amidohydrolase